MISDIEAQAIEIERNGADALDLSSTGLMYIMTLPSAAHIISLDLSGNFLIDFRFAIHSKMLIYLNVSRNLISSLDFMSVDESDATPILPNLTTLDLSHNRLSCKHSLSPLKSIQSLTNVDLTGNPIDTDDDDGMIAISLKSIIETQDKVISSSSSTGEIMTNLLQEWRNKTFSLLVRDEMSTAELIQLKQATKRELDLMQSKMLLSESRLVERHDELEVVSSHQVKLANQLTTECNKHEICKAKLKHAESSFKKLSMEYKGSLTNISTIVSNLQQFFHVFEFQLTSHYSLLTGLTERLDRCSASLKSVKDYRSLEQVTLRNDYAILAMERTIIANDTSSHHHHHHGSSNKLSSEWESVLRYAFKMADCLNKGQVTISSLILVLQSEHLACLSSVHMGRDGQKGCNPIKQLIGCLYARLAVVKSSSSSSSMTWGEVLLLLMDGTDDDCQPQHDDDDDVVYQDLSAHIWKSIEGWAVIPLDCNHLHLMDDDGKSKMTRSLDVGEVVTFSNYDPFTRDNDDDNTCQSIDPSSKQVLNRLISERHHLLNRMQQQSNSFNDFAYFIKRAWKNTLRTVLDERTEKINRESTATVNRMLTQKANEFEAELTSTRASMRASADDELERISNKLNRDHEEEIGEIGRSFDSRVSKLNRIIDDKSVRIRELESSLARDKLLKEQQESFDSYLSERLESTIMNEETMIQKLSSAERSNVLLESRVRQLESDLARMKNLADASAKVSPMLSRPKMLMSSNQQYDRQTLMDDDNSSVSSLRHIPSRDKRGHHHHQQQQRKEIVNDDDDDSRNSSIESESVENDNNNIINSQNHPSSIAVPIRTQPRQIKHTTSRQPGSASLESEIAKEMMVEKLENIERTVQQILHEDD